MNSQDAVHEDLFPTEFLNNLKLALLVDEKQENEVIITLTARGKQARAVTTLNDLPRRLQHTGTTLSKVLEFKRPAKEAQIDKKIDTANADLCAECGHPVEPGWTYCTFCWTILPDTVTAKTREFPERGAYTPFKDIRFCDECKEPVHKHMTYCPFCWTELE